MAKFSVGITRDLLNPDGAPAFGREALQLLDGSPAVDWEWIPESPREITPDIAARYDAIHLNGPRAAISQAQSFRSRLRANRPCRIPCP